MRKSVLSALSVVLCLIVMLTACGYVAQPIPPLGTTNDQNEVHLHPSYEPLVFNHLVSTGMMSFSPAEWPVAFSHDLSDTQYTAAFSVLNLNLHAQANYAEDGTLIDVSAVSHGQSRIHIHVGVDRRSISHTMSHISDDHADLWDNLETSQVHGVTVTARIIDEQFEFTRLSEGEMFFDAWFDLHGVRHHVCFNSTLYNGQLLMTNIVNQLILNGIEWIALLKEPIIPELHNDWLTLAQAKLDPDFGEYLPQTVPGGFVFERSRRFMNQDWNYLFVEWRAPPDYDYLYELYRQWVTSRGSDVGVWPFDEIFWADDVITWYVTMETAIDNRMPVLLAEEFTLDTVQEYLEIWLGISQAMYPDGSGGEVSIMYERSLLNFAVRIGDIVVSVRAEGVPAEDVWALFEGVAW